MKKNNSGIILLLPLIIIGTLIVVGAILHSQKNKQTAELPDQKESSTLDFQKADCVNGIYTDTVVGFSIKCPEGSSVYVYRDYYDQYLKKQTRQVSLCMGELVNTPNNIYICKESGITIWANGEGWGGGCDPPNHATITINNKEEGYCLYDNSFSLLSIGDETTKNWFLLTGQFSNSFTKKSALDIIKSFKPIP